MILRSTELPAVIGEDGANGQTVLLIKGQHVVVNQSGGAFRLLAGVQEPESASANLCPHDWFESLKDHPRL